MTQPAYFPFSEGDPLTTVPVGFARICQQVPAQQLAYVGDDRTLTYAALAAASQGVANALTDLLGLALTREQQQAVALLLPHQAESLIGILGTLQAGHFYIPLDFVMGAATLRQILVDCPPRVILTTTALQAQALALLPAEQQPVVLCIDTLAPVAVRSQATLPSDPMLYASVQYTSGSTGKPRGVVRTHATNLYTYYLARHDLGLTVADRASHLLSYAHSFSTPTIIGGLLNGATLYARPLGALTALALYRWIAEHQITNLSVSIGMLRELAALAVTHPPLTSLRSIGTGGEAMKRAEVEQLCQLLPTGCRLVYRLASTEAGAYARFILAVGQPWVGDHIPVGYVPPGQELLCLDEDHKPVAAGEPGEMAVRSPFLCAGYWERPADNAAKFLPATPDHPYPTFLTGDSGRISAAGLVEFLGRKDFMVKIRGYRVQLEEVEAALQALPSIQSAVVVAQPAPMGDQRLVAYLVPHSQPAPSVSALRQSLGARLPTYMIPALFKFLDQLPLTAIGKVDRKALPLPSAERPVLDTPFVAPRSEREAQVAALWEEILEIYPIGIHDDFFELGGHSLALLTLTTQLKERFTQEISLTAFIQRATIAEMAARLTELAQPTSAVPQPAPLSTPSASVASTTLVHHYLSGQRKEEQPPTGTQFFLDQSLPYATRIRAFRFLARQPLVQKRFFGETSQTLRDFMDALAIPREAADEFVTCHLVRLLCKRYARGALTRALQADFARWGRVTGASYLAEAHQRGQGVILLSIHTIYWSGLLPIALQQLGYTDLFEYGGTALTRQNPALLAALQAYFQNQPKEVVNAKFLGLQMDTAQQTLQRGGFVWIAADGGSGGGDAISLPIFQRVHPFKPGFAELALHTGATIVPLQRAITVTGEVAFSFLPPLDSGTPTASHSERVQGLMQQYIAFLEACWQQDPANLSTRRMRRYLQHASRQPTQQPASFQMIEERS
ncbi:MAG: AMP-binding protein [Caldilineaceae bacterium]|nr:AMP-binding protein [Caldilineaceae bacterium]